MYKESCNKNTFVLIPQILDPRKRKTHKRKILLLSRNLKYLPAHLGTFVEEENK